MSRSLHAPFDALILAGGRGSRLGGVDKAAVDLAGEPLVQAPLTAARDARTLVVVGQTSAPLPPRTRLVCEEPPGSGPAAALLTGLAAVENPAPWTLLLSCDVPGAAAAAATLLSTTCPAPSDGLVLVDPDGRLQWTLGLYRTSALAQASAGVRETSNLSLRSVLGSLPLTEVPATGDEWRDVDTWDDHAVWTARLSQHRGTPEDG